MKKYMTLAMVLAVTGIVLAGFVGAATADRGYGRGGYGWHGCPKGDGGYGGGPGRGGCWANLSEEELEKAEAERNAFFEGTEALRQQRYEKRAEITAVMAKTTPDAAAAKALQKEISEIEAQLDQMRIEHMIRMKAINPNLGMGYGKGWGRHGNGRGHKHGMGYGHGRGHGCGRR